MSNKVRMEIEGFGAMEIELYPESAPITVENFLSYVKSFDLILYFCFNEFIIEISNVSNLSSYSYKAFSSSIIKFCFGCFLNIF